MTRTIDVTIPVPPDVAATLADARNRETIGRRMTRVLRPHAGSGAVVSAIAAMKAEARGAGLTDTDIDSELAAYDAWPHWN